MIDKYSLDIRIGRSGGERAKERGESLITFSPCKEGEAPQARIQDFEMGGEFL